MCFFQVTEAMNLQQKLARLQLDAAPKHYEAELDINDLPHNVLWKVTHRDTLGPISFWTGASITITTKGQVYPPGSIVAPGERKLCLVIQGSTELSVNRGRSVLSRILEDTPNQTRSSPR